MRIVHSLMSNRHPQLDARPAHYWPTDTLLTVPHHILGARLSAEDMAALAAINAEENSPVGRSLPLLMPVLVLAVGN